MRRDMKQEIMDKAMVLFGEVGYNQVSLRGIADALGISVGNLTYYFPKKEALVEAVILRQHEGYRPKPPAKTVAELDQMFLQMLRHQEQNGYYFRHYTQLSQISPKIYAIQLEVLGNRREAIFTSLDNLVQSGMMIGEQLPNQYRYLTSALEGVCVFGAPHQENVMERRQLLWSILYGFLTEQGRAVWHSEVGPKPSDGRKTLDRSEKIG